MERKTEALATTTAENLDSEPDHANGKAIDVAFTEPVQPQAKPSPIVLRAPEEWSLALEPRSTKAAWEVATSLHNSRLYPKLGSIEAIFTVILRGRSLGMDATTALSAFHNMDGKLVMHADLIEALVLRSGKAEYFEIMESTAKVATYCTKRVGGKREQTMSFAIEDAFAAQLVVKDPNGVDGFNGRDKEGKPSPGSNWSKYRAVMLRHRAKTQLARAVYADVVLGLYCPDELE